MEKLKAEIPESQAFVYPYTKLGPEDIDAVVAGAIIYDRLYYLDYRLPYTKNRPIFQGVQNLIDPKRIGYQGVLEVLLENGSLAPLSADEVRNRVPTRNQEHHDDAFARMCLRNRDFLRKDGLVSRAGLNKLSSMYLADKKIDSTLRTAYGWNVPSSRGLGETKVLWEDAASILAGYADCVSQSHKASPFGVDSLHSEVLQALLRTEAEPLKDAGVMLRNILEIPVPTVSNAWTLDLENLALLLGNIRATRKKAHAEIEKYLSDEVARYRGGTQKDVICRASDDIITSIRDLDEQVEQLKRHKESRIVKYFGYVIAGMWFTTTLIREETRNLSIFTEPAKMVRDLIGERVDDWIRRKKEAKIRGHRFYNTHSFLKQIGRPLG
jgi:hypothetical protein